MGNVTQNDRAEAVEFVEGSILAAQETGKNGEERCLRDLLVALNAGIAAQETLDAAQKRAKEEATAASWFAEQNEIEQEKRRAAEAERDAAQDDLRIADAERDEAKARIERCAPVADEGLAEFVAYWTEQAAAWSSTDNYSEEADPEHADKCRQTVNTVARLAEQLASCRKALDVVRVGSGLLVGKLGYYGYWAGGQPPEQFFPNLAAVIGCPAEHLTGAPKGAEGSV